MIKMIFLFVCIFSLEINAQDQKISASEYQVINELFNSGNDGKKAFVYGKTYFDKSWANYFLDLNEILKRVGVPTKISDEELKQILNNNTGKKIHSKILRQKPLELENSKLNKHIKLVKSFDKPRDLKKGVIRISRPIIIDTVAVVKKIGYQESPVFILTKKEGNWEVVYTFYDWLILE